MADITLPIGGVTNQCGICGRHVDTGEPGSDTNYIALNGLICRDCTANINHFTPAWYCIEPAHHTSIEVFEYSGYPDTPFYEGAVGGLFLSVDYVSDPTALRDFYHRLEADVKRLLWTVPLGVVPDGWTELTPEWSDDHPPYSTYTTTETPEEHPYRELKRHLPRPFILAGGSIIAPEGGITDTVRSLLSPIDNESADLGQVTLADTPSDTTQEGNVSEDATERTSTHSSGQDAATRQAGLGAYS